MRFPRIFAACVLALAAGTAQAQNRFAIVRVEELTTPDCASGGASAPVPSQMPKFMDAYAPVPKEAFEVTWQPPARGAPAGTMVTLEYRHRQSGRIKFLFIKYPFPVKEERKAVFQIPPAATRQLGPVSAWRARVVAGGRRMAEVCSDSWTD